MFFTDEEDDEEEPPIYDDETLSILVDPILRDDDTNRDGLIDYPEFVAATLRTKSGQREPVELRV
jgi:hypothetical protein